MISFPLDVGSVFERVMVTKKPVLAEDCSLLVFPVLDETDEVAGIVSMAEGLAGTVVLGAGLSRKCSAI